MTVQLSLLQESNIKKTIITVPIEELKLSEFNPRQTRPEDDIDKLAQRIARNGFEITRALWAVRNGKGYEVFAGGTRLEAARRANVKKIPIVLHEELTEDDVVRLADEDNGNDEYHTPVNCVDTWLSYKALEDKNWTQQRIAESKGVSQTIVSFRLQLAELPQSVLHNFITTPALNERHAREIIELLPGNNLSPYITREQAILEVIESVLKKSPTNPTAAQFKDKVTEMNTLLGFVEKCADALEDDWRDTFLKQLKKTRSTDQVQKVYSRIVQTIAEIKRRREEEAQAQADEATRHRLEADAEAAKQERIRRIMDRLVCGDAREAIALAPAGIKLIVSDPPYGKDFQSNRRVKTTKAEKIEGDQTLDDALELLKDVLGKCYSKMAENSTLFIFSAQEYEPEFRQAIKDCGFTYRATYIWNKPNHGSGDLQRTHSPKHECIIHAVKGDPKFDEDIKRPDSVLEGNDFLDGEHPTKKPLDLLRLLIETWSGEYDWVIDPFAGIGSVPVAAKQSNRLFWACELNEDYHKVMTDQILGMIKDDDNG